jgi:NAD(P)H-nitrite reductase large subunit
MNTNNTDPSDEIICPCSGTKRSKIQSLIEQGFDADTISRKTGAISGCGGCEWDIAEMVEAFIASNHKSNE